MIHRLIDALRKALPGVSEQELYRSYRFLSGALTLTLPQTGRIDRWSDGLCKGSDFTPSPGAWRRSSPAVSNVGVNRQPPQNETRRLESFAVTSRG